MIDFDCVGPGLYVDALSPDRDLFLDHGLSPCLCLDPDLCLDPYGAGGHYGGVGCGYGHAVGDPEGFHLGTQEGNKAVVPRKVLRKIGWEDDRGREAEERGVTRDVECVPQGLEEAHGLDKEQEGGMSAVEAGSRAVEERRRAGDRNWPEEDQVGGQEAVGGQEDHRPKAGHKGHAEDMDGVVEEAVQGSLRRSCSEDMTNRVPGLAGREQAPGEGDSRAQEPEPGPEQAAAAAAAGAAGSHGTDNWPVESGGLVAVRIG